MTDTDVLMAADSSTTPVYDVAVLGAGVQGSATAYYLAKKAGVKNVLLLEKVIVAS